MKISAVIYCKNHRSSLPACITSFQSQTRPFDDICLVDDGSTDGTRYDVKKLTNPFFHYIYVPNVGFKSAILSGLHQVAGDVILIASANNWFDARFLDTYSSYLGRTDFGGVVGSAFQQVFFSNHSSRVMIVPLIHFDASDLIFTTRWALERSKFFLNKKAEYLGDLIWALYTAKQQIIIYKEPLYFRGTNPIQLQKQEDRIIGSTPDSIKNPEYQNVA